MISGASWRGDGGGAPALVYELPLPDDDDDGNRSAHTLDSRARSVLSVDRSEQRLSIRFRADHPRYASHATREPRE